MTDELRVALVAVAMAAGLDFDTAWTVVDEVAGEVTGDARQLAAEVAQRAGTSSWTGPGGRTQVG